MSKLLKELQSITKRPKIPPSQENTIAHIARMVARRYRDGESDTHEVVLELKDGICIHDNGEIPRNAELSAEDDSDAVKAWLLFNGFAVIRATTHTIKFNWAD